MSTLPPRWRSPEPPVELADGDLHLWRVALDLASDRDPVERLSDDERARAARFHRPEDRRRWEQSRGWLRRLLARYLGVPPDEIRLRAGRRDKPTVDGPSEVAFNAAHSADVALFAFCRVRVGVDVERHRTDLDIDGIAARVLGPELAATLRDAGASDRVARFTQLWTRHEAAGKCRGSGIDERHHAEMTAGLWISDVAVGDGFAAAVASERAPTRILGFDPDLR